MKQIQSCVSPWFNWLFINEKVCLVTKVHEPVVYVINSVQNVLILIYGQDVQNCFTSSQILAPQWWNNFEINITAAWWKMSVVNAEFSDVFDSS